MALVGSISGSAGTNSVIGVTGSVIFSNNPAASFPTDLPGADVQFFVSGSRGGKNGTTRNVAVFGGDAVVSGSLTVGTGSVVITSNDIQIGSTGHVQFDTAANRISVVGGELKFFDSVNTGGFTLSALGSGGGGGGGTFFTENGSGVIYNSGSVAFTGARTGEAITAASQKGVDVQFYFSGSNAAGDSAKVALFGGPIVSSGSISVKAGGADPAITLSTGGVISGSGDFQAGGNLAVAGTLDIGNSTDTTISRASAGRIAVEGVNVVTISSSDTLTNKTINLADNTLTATSAQLATAISDETGSGALVFANTPTLTTPTIAQINNAAGSITLDAVNEINLDSDSGSIVLKDNGTTFASLHNATGQLEIRNSAGTAAITLTSLGNVIIPGDLTVQGTTLTVDATTVEIEDPVIGLGFASGSNDTTLAVGDRGFIGGLSGVDNAAFIWDHSESGFATIRTAAGTATGVPITVSDYAPLRTGKLELGGFSGNVYLTSSDGTSVNLNVATAASASFSINGSKRIEFGEQSVGQALVKGVNGVNLADLWLSGSFVNLGHSAGNAVRIFGAGQEGGRIQTASSNLFLIARDGAGNGQVLNLTGSEVKIGTNGGGGQNISFLFGHNQTRGLARFDGANNLFVLGSQAGVGLVLSSSSGNVRATHPETSGLGLYVDASTTPHFDIVKNSTTTTAAGGSGQNVKLGSGTGTTTLTLSGSTVEVNAGTSGLNLKKDNTLFAKISSPSANVVDFEAASTFTTANVVNTVATTVNIGGAATTVEIGAASGTTSINNSLTVDGNVTLGNATDDDITFTGRAASDLLPKTDSFYNLGAADKRWANIYTGDLHLRNDRGNWTIIEEEEYLSITNNISGKRYKFVLEEL